MKISTSVVLAAAAARGVAAEEAFDAHDRTRYSSGPSSSGSPRRRSNRSSVDKTCGSSVTSGTPLTKAKQQARKDPWIGSLGLDGKFDQKEKPAEPNEGTFSWLATKMRLDSPQLDVFTPEAGTHTTEDYWQGRPPGNLRGLLIASMLFLIVFGALYTLGNYLLDVTRASASCTPSTVYIPVTRYVPTSSAAPASDGDTTTSLVTIYSTSTATSTVTSYITMQPAAVATGLTTSGGPSYFFTVDSAGSTDWINGISPPATASLTVVTTSIFVTPRMPSTSTTTATISSTDTIYQTVTVPAYTSTAYSFVEPDTTLTSTSTQYVTYTLSRVSSASSVGTDSSRSSFSSPGIYGWNSTSSAVLNPSGVAAAAQAEPQLTSMTEVHFWGDGNRTTSTQTNYITTSVQVAYTTVITPSIPEHSAISDLVTTVTALPVTITYSGGRPYSTSKAFNGSEVASVGSSAIASSSGLGTSPPVSTGVSGVGQAAQSSSSGGFVNSTNPATVSAAGYSPEASQASSLSISAASPNQSTANPVTTNASSSETAARSPIATLPRSISQSTTIENQSVSSFGNASARSSLNHQSNIVGSSLAASASSLLSSTAVRTSQSFATIATISSPLPPSSLNATALSSISATGPANSTSRLSSSILRPAYGSYSQPLTSSTAATAGPVSGSSLSASSLQPLMSSPPPSPMASSSSLTSSRTLSASTRSANLANPVSTVTASNTTLATSLSTSYGRTSSTTLRSSMVPANSLSTTSLLVTGIPATASSMPTMGCGEYGNFMLDFDNLPRFTSNDQDQDEITQAPPILNPYHHFTFSDGYVYAPDPKVPFEPISQPHLAVFLGHGTGMRVSQAGRSIEPGEFADGPYEASSAFWFDAFSAWLGCDNEGPEVCTLVMNAYTYSPATQDEVLSFTQNTTIQGCLSYVNCKLRKVEFPDTFKGLSGLQIQAYVKDEERMFFMDDVAMRWSDNSCAAGLTRQRAR